jgi:hypothetical protein
MQKWKLKAWIAKIGKIYCQKWAQLSIKSLANSQPWAENDQPFQPPSQHFPPASDEVMKHT